MWFKNRTEALGVIAAAFFGAGGAVIVAFLSLVYPQFGEKTALVTEAGYLCDAMAWQVFYVAGQLPPSDWKEPGAASRLNFEEPAKSAWDKPWFPLRTPIWDRLEDKVGDLGSHAGRLAGFFYRVEFINMLRQARDCFGKGDPRFWHTYLCTLRDELNLCATHDYGRQSCHWFLSFRYGCAVDFGPNYREIVRQLDSVEKGGVCRQWGDDMPAEQPGCKNLDMFIR
jgi:hypothetical protein